MNQIQTKDISHKQDWEQFILDQPQANFLSSWNWGQFHRQINHQVFYRGYYQQQKLIGVALFIHEPARRGPHLTIAGGPIIDWQNHDLVKAFVSDAKQLSKQLGAWFVRIRPQVLDTPNHQKRIKGLGFIKSPMHLAAELTLQLDLQQTHDQLLMQMRKNTRYEIRKSQKLKLTIKKSTNPDEIKEFNQHQLDLAQKHHFVPFPYDFLFHQFKTFAAENQALLIHSFHQGQLLASAFVIYYGREAVYHYGISTPANHRLPGAYACQWAAILEAKKRGLTRYNFWGIAPEDQPDHRFASLSVFKRGFGGSEVSYLPAHDLPVSPLYSTTKLFETLRAKKRHL